MKITIEIATDNAAFDSDFMDTEVARILRTVAEDWPNVGKLRDYNGNTVGAVTVTGGKRRRGEYAAYLAGRVPDPRD